MPSGKHVLCLILMEDIFEMVYVPPSELGQTTRVSGNEDDNKTKKPGEKHTLAPSGEDSFVRRSWNYLTNLAGSFLPGGEKTEGKIAPPKPISLSATERLSKLGYSPEQIDQMLSQSRSPFTYGLPTLEDYASSSDYYIERGGSHTHTEYLVAHAGDSHVDEHESFAELYKEMMEKQMLANQENQEYARVFLAMSAVSYNPKLAVRSLAGMLSGLQFPGPLALATGELSDAASFAQKWAQKVAKEDPDFAKQLANSLKGIVVNFNTQCGANQECFQTCMESDCAPHAHEVPVEVTTVEELVVRDAHTHEVVDVFTFESHCIEMQESICDEKVETGGVAQATLDSVSRDLDSTEKDVNRKHTEFQKQKDLMANNKTELEKIDRRLASAKNDPLQKQTLTRDKNNLQARMIGRA